MLHALSLPSAAQYTLAAVYIALHSSSQPVVICLGKGGNKYLEAT